MTDPKSHKYVKKLVKQYEYFSLRDKSKKAHSSITEIFGIKTNTNTEHANVGAATCSKVTDSNKKQTSEIVYSKNETFNGNSVASDSFIIETTTTTENPKTVTTFSKIMGNGEKQTSNSSLHGQTVFMQSELNTEIPKTGIAEAENPIKQESVTGNTFENDTGKKCIKSPNELQTFFQNDAIAKFFDETPTEVLDDSDHDSFATDEDEFQFCNEFAGSVSKTDKNEYDKLLAEKNDYIENCTTNAVKTDKDKFKKDELLVEDGFAKEEIKNKFETDQMFQINQVNHSSSVRTKNDKTGTRKKSTLEKSNSFSASTQQELNKMPKLSWTFDSKSIDEHYEKLKQILAEFIDNYQYYLKTLEVIMVMSYKIPVEEAAISTSNFSPQKTTYFFGNIADIYEATKIFNKELQSQKLCISDLLELYSKKHDMLKLYPYYMANKKRSYKYLSHFFKFYNTSSSIISKHQLDSDLLSPTQRLVKDQNMFKRILGEYKKMMKIINVEKKINKINEVIHLIDTTIKEGTTIIELESINNCPFDIDVTGLFIRKDNFTARNSFQNINLESTIVLLLFENIVIFADNPLCGEDGHEMYEFKYSILLQNLGYSSLEKDTLNFEFTDFKDGKRSIVFKARRMRIKDEWTKIINKKLMQQLIKHRDDTLRRKH